MFCNECDCHIKSKSKVYKYYCRKFKLHVLDDLNGCHEGEKKVIEKIEEKVVVKMEQVYSGKCTKCGEYTHLIFDKDKDGEPIYSIEESGMMDFMATSVCNCGHQERVIAYAKSEIIPIINPIKITGKLKIKMWINGLKVGSMYKDNELTGYDIVDKDGVQLIEEDCISIIKELDLTYDDIKSYLTKLDYNFIELETNTVVYKVKEVAIDSLRELQLYLTMKLTSLN